MIDSGKWDEIKRIQSLLSPALKVGDKAQTLFFHKDNESREKSGKWSTGSIYLVSNKRNLRKENGNFYPKKCS